MGLVALEINNIIWAAGFFDGEGCIKVQRQKVSYGYKLAHRLVIHISQKIKTPLVVFNRLFGGNIYKRLDGYEWCVSGKKAIEALSKLEPYLVLKKDECEVALDCSKYFINSKKINKIIFNGRQKAYSTLRRIKDRKYGRNHEKQAET